jgi:anthranilate phosphoribosyltransferase
VVGVSDPSLLELIAGGLRELGHERALVVHGEPGLDEISPIGPTDIIELKEGELTRYTLDPADVLGTTTFDPAELAGGDPAYNADVVLRVLRGEMRGAARAAVLLNAGAALLVGGAADTLLDGVRLAEQSLEDGAGIAALERLRTSTRAAAIRN